MNKKHVGAKVVINETLDKLEKIKCDLEQSHLRNRELEIRIREGKLHRVIVDDLIGASNAALADAVNSIDSYLNYHNMLVVNYEVADIENNSRIEKIGELKEIIRIKSNLIKGLEMEKGSLNDQLNNMELELERVSKLIAGMVSNNESLNINIDSKDLVDITTKDRAELVKQGIIKPALKVSDNDIIKLKMSGMSNYQIANKLGYSQGSAITYRLNKITKNLIDQGVSIEEIASKLNMVVKDGKLTSRNIRKGE